MVASPEGAETTSTREERCEIETRVRVAEPSKKNMFPYSALNFSQ